MLMKVLLLTALLLGCWARELQAPVSGKEKSTREWDAAASKQLDDDQEHEAVIKMGGSPNALVNILIGDTSTGTIYPVGNREYGILTANYSTLAREFLEKVGRSDDLEDMEKVVYWMHQGAGTLCDGCKVMVEEMQRTVLAVSNAKIKKSETTDRKFIGGAGHQIVMDGEVKDAIRSLWRNPGYYEVDKYLRDWAKEKINGAQSDTIMSTLTAGSFGMDDLLQRKSAICSGILRVCPLKPPEPDSQTMSSCRACVEGFQDFGHKLSRDRKDIEIGKMDRKKGGSMYCSRKHVYYRLQELQESLGMYHRPESVAKIQEVVEQIVDEHENDVVGAFVEGCKEQVGAGAKAVCTDIAEMCDNDEFDELLPKAQSYHVPTDFPKTHALDLDYQQAAVRNEL